MILILSLKKNYPKFPYAECTDFIINSINSIYCNLFYILILWDFYGHNFKYSFLLVPVFLVAWKRVFLYCSFSFWGLFDFLLNYFVEFNEDNRLYLGKYLTFLSENGQNINRNLTSFWYFLPVLKYQTTESSKFHW